MTLLSLVADGPADIFFGEECKLNLIYSAVLYEYKDINHPEVLKAKKRLDDLDTRKQQWDKWINRNRYEVI